MSTRNLLNSNMWQLVSPDINNEPEKIFNKYIPIPSGNYVGGVKPDNITTYIDGIGTISALANGTIGAAQFVPYISFVSSPVAAANQTFGSNLFSYYFGNSNFATLSVDGAILQPDVDYLMSTTSVTILTYLLPSSLVEVQAKTLPIAPASATDIVTEDGLNLITEGGDNISIQQVFS